jgi:hypothetical protein
VIGAQAFRATPWTASPDPDDVVMTGFLRRLDRRAALLRASSLTQDCDL